ncbi:penicillin-binding protein 1A [soil metagenome]
MTFGGGQGGSGGRGGLFDGRPRLRATVYWGAVASVWLLIVAVAVIAFFARGLPDTNKLTAIQRQPAISYLDRSGALIAVRGSQYAPPVDLDSLPAYVPAAFVAIEDHNFYHHLGFDLGGIIRSLAYNATHHGGPLRGGSTITQQLAKNLFLTPEQSTKRKVQELLLSVWLEWKFKKKQILALYMNRVNFGGGAYGIESAAQRYFNKPASQLSIGESALLAGLLKAPSRYSPVSDQERAARRATIVLDRMVQTRAITLAQEQEAFSRPVIFSKTLSSQHAQYFVDWVDAQLRAILGGRPEELQKDLVVETTLDLPIDTAAELSASQVVERDAKQGVQNAAVVALDSEGRVRAMIGGVSYGQSQFNRAVDAKRQAGSSWKPFVYLTAMENGRTPDVQVMDEPLTIGNWSPHNYTNKYLGQITLATALAQSINTVAARLANEIGTDAVARTARRLGITSAINTDPAMALGTSSVSPLEMAQAYVPFSNGGIKAPAWGIERIRTADGQILYEHHVDQRTAVIANPALSYMNRMMRGVMTSPGTGARAAIKGYDIAGKTGTTSDYRDAWFIGYTGGFVTAVWVGKDDNSPMKKVTGGGAPAEIWRAFMSAALPRLKVAAIPAGPDAPPQAADAAGSEDPITELLKKSGENGEGGAVALPGGEGDESPAERQDRLDRERFDRDRDSAFGRPPAPARAPDSGYAPRDRDAIDRLMRGPN